jgi:hypothetical protein
MMEKGPTSVRRGRRRGEIRWMPEKARGRRGGEWRVASGELEEEADSSLRSE